MPAAGPFKRRSAPSAAMPPDGVLQATYCGTFFQSDMNLASPLSVSG